MFYAITRECDGQAHLHTRERGQPALPTLPVWARRWVNSTHGFVGLQTPTGGSSTHSFTLPPLDNGI